MNSESKPNDDLLPEDEPYFVLGDPELGVLSRHVPTGREVEEDTHSAGVKKGRE